MVRAHSNTTLIKVRQNSKACETRPEFCTALPAYYEAIMTPSASSLVSRAATDTRDLAGSTGPIIGESRKSSLL